MYRFCGRFCHIEELTTSNNVDLHYLMLANSDEYRNLVFNEPIPVEYPLFVQLIKKWFDSGRQLQFLVRTRNEILAGTIFVYGVDKSESYLKCSCFFMNQFRGGFVICESMLESLYFALDLLRLENCYFTVFSWNNHMIQLAGKLGASLVKIDKMNNKWTFKLSKGEINNLLIKLIRQVKES